MNIQYNLRVARMIQWASCTIGFFTISLVFLLLVPGWRRVKKAVGVKVAPKPQAAPSTPAPDARSTIE